MTPIQTLPIAPPELPAATGHTKPSPHPVAADPTPPAPVLELDDFPAVCRWLEAVATAAGPPLSATVSTIPHTVHVHVATPEEFQAWRAALPPAPAPATTQDALGTSLEANVRVCDWSITVVLFRAARFAGSAR